MSDLVVVGGGLAGCMAALGARDADPSAAITLVTVPPEQGPTESAFVDVLGYPPDSDEPVQRPLDAIEGLPADHPYSRVGVETVHTALDLFEDTMRESDRIQYTGDPEQNALVGTPIGGLRPAAQYPESVAPGLLSDDSPLHLVGFEQLTHVDVEFVADRLRERVPYDIEATTVRFPVRPSEYPPVREYARALDENDPLSAYHTDDDADDAVPVREALANRIRPELDVAPRVGFPALLGLENTPAIRSELEALLQADVFELPFGEPSLPGIRRTEWLYDHLASQGVTVERTDGLQQIVMEDDRIEYLLLGGTGSAHGDRYLLTTGDFTTGGLESTRSGITEPRFDCHVPQPDDSGEWADQNFLDDHPFARFGLDVSDSFQPLGPDGGLEYENLWAAGTILGGSDFTAQLARSGIDIVTGYDAGRAAIEGQ